MYRVSDIMHASVSYSYFNFKGFEGEKRDFWFYLIDVDTCSGTCVDYDDLISLYEDGQVFGVVKCLDYYIVYNITGFDYELHKALKFTGKVIKSIRKTDKSARCIGGNYLDVSSNDVYIDGIFEQMSNVSAITTTYMVNSCRFSHTVFDCIRRVMHGSQHEVFFIGDNYLYIPVETGYNMFKIVDKAFIAKLFMA